jgi:hypothetical protein
MIRLSLQYLPPAGALGAIVARLSAKSQRYRTICDGFDRYWKPDIPWHVLPSMFR